jgi:hypothetical protein
MCDRCAHGFDAANASDDGGNDGSDGRDEVLRRLRRCSSVWSARVRKNTLLFGLDYEGNSMLNFEFKDR